MGQVKPHVQTVNYLQKSRSHFRRRNARVFAHGYAATSMDRVAIAAGVSTTVYSHFQDKEGLFTALIQRLVEESSAQF